MNLPTIFAAVPLTMNTRDIAELTGKRHDHVLRDAEKMLADLGETSPQFWGDLPDSYGRSQRLGILPKRETLILISGYSVEMRARIIDRWQELEAGAAPALNLRQPGQLLTVAAQLAELVQEQQALLSAQAPKVAFAEAVGAAVDLQSIGAVAKALGTGERRLFAFLRENGVLMVNNLPFQAHLDCGRFKVIERPWTDAAGGARVSLQTMVTGKGITFLQQRLAKAAALVGSDERAES